MSGEQVRAALRRFHEGAAVVQLKPTARERQIKAGPVFGRRPLVAKQEGAIEFLNVDAALPDRLESVGVLHQTARGLFGVCVYSSGPVSIVRLFLAADSGSVRRIGGVAFGLSFPARRKVPVGNAIPGDGPPIARRAVRRRFHGHDVVSLVWVVLVGRWMLDGGRFAHWQKTLILISHRYRFQLRDNIINDDSNSALKIVFLLFFERPISGSKFWA
jgi:hypothetical protein